MAYPVPTFLRSISICRQGEQTKTWKQENQAHSEGSDRNGVDSSSLSVEGYVSLVMVREELFEVYSPTTIGSWPSELAQLMTESANLCLE